MAHNIDHLYANTQMMEEERKGKKEKVNPTTTLLRKEKLLQVRSSASGSYPDLLEMVTRSNSPSAREQAGMYAKVDLSRKRSRPNSDASTIESNGSSTTTATTPAGGNGGLDSYTRTLIDRFNSFLETEGHSDHRKPM